MEHTWAILIQFGFVILIVVGMLVMSYLMGERHHERFTDEPYESGIVPTGSGRVPFSVKYYLVAMFFVIFDLEAAFVFAWAVAARDLGWRGYSEIVVFIGILLAGLVYLWRCGALDWSASSARVGHKARRGRPRRKRGTTG